MMTVFDTTANLRSFREASGRQVPREEVGRIIEAGRRAPSPGNVQSVEFIVVESDHSKSLLAEAAGDERLENVPIAVVVTGDIGRMERRIGGSEAVTACNYEVAGAVQNMRLVAHEEGVSSCWVTGFDSLKVKQGLSIPEKKEPMGIVGLCYAKSEYESEKKFGFGEVVYYEEYGHYMDSIFDALQWKGLKENRNISEKRIKGFLSRLLGS